MGLASAILSSNREVQKKQGNSQNLIFLCILTPKPLQEPEVVLICNCCCYSGRLIWWTNAEHRLSFSLRFGLWLGMFGCSILDSVPFTMLPSFMFSASLFLLGTLSAIRFPLFSSSSYVVLCLSLVASLDITWTWDLQTEEHQMTKSLISLAGDTNESTRMLLILIQIQLMQPIIQ